MAKDELFQSMFEQKTKKYKKPIDGKTIDIYLYPTIEGQAQLFNALYRKYQGVSAHSYQDFMNECAALTYKAISRFDVEDNMSWEGILSGSDRKNIGKLMSNIKRTVKNDLIKFVNEKSKFTRVQNQDAIVNFSTESLSERLDTNDGETLERYEMVSESYWDVQDGYEQDFFIKWFQENKEKVLIKSQIKLLEGLAMCQNDSEYTENDVYAVTGVPSHKINTKLARIAEKVTEAFEKAYPGYSKSITDVEKESQNEMLIDFLTLTNTFEYESQEVTEWIVARMDNEFLTNTFYDYLNPSDTQDWLQAFKEDSLIPEHVVFEMVESAKEKAVALSNWETEKVKFHVKHTDNRFDKLLHALYNARTREFKERPCYVYDRFGNLLRTEKFIPETKKTQIIEVTPAGIVKSE